MTVIRNNSISGINSITAQSGALNFYDSTGNTLSIGADVTGGVTVATGATISGSTNTIIASTNGSERVRIDSSGNFNLVNTAGVMTAFKYETPALINNHFKSNSTSAGAYVRMYASAGTGQWDIYNNGANLRFSDNASAGNIQMDRPLVMNSQNIVMSSGNGIDFSATADSSGTMGSELLDDYEEGTFTPGIQGTTVGGSASFAVANGTYTKVGRLVTIQVFLSWSSGTGSGAMQITGLPFGTLSGNRFYAVSISDSTISTSANHILRGRTENSATTIILKEEPVGGGSQQNGTYDSAAQIILSCSYHTST